ncbi:MAG: bifunctional phosphoribosyl-AMP cyclohydrolase/phosphoribosyl-ATP diphosphatase HisIE [Syntrophothermus sp.]|uniref:bifunctional phosphoribosyl-AMP cyclohydrolase/phosphoribosyl-ATP diphosphatase HisIE n=1 Tax=Syntrophothermus sp. TaxID=2736299 RepID=UPI00257B7836|nr:bifunctional phosphoribosyl-AMP cyclohydrolase/phosphoribosyl-ATP diphosphatase HisIE [Syntrophothermus sp.]NSW82906.1 bifunctional phosphoribosyl-AMP cyclohydrolase/phosphoribosyl-ATP diphosphatase HisIE [Syntrophothermus sp.]
MSRGFIEQLKFDEKGLIPAIIQDEKTQQVLMLAYMNRESLLKTLESGYTWFYSRSRQCLWMKGESSGNIQRVKNIYYDCDRDSLLITVDQEGAACHTGHYSCFYRDWDGTLVSPRLFDPEEVYPRRPGTPSILFELYEVIQARQRLRPEGSYTSYLFNEGQDKILKKVGEESTEVVIASKNNSEEQLVYELADLMYHLLVLMVYHGVELKDVFAELRSRR